MSARIVLKVRKLPHFEGELPEYKTAFASAFDVRACLPGGAKALKPQERALIPTGLCFEIPEGYELQVRPRSGLALKKGLAVLNSPGTIDADYRGEIKILVINLGQEALSISHQDRIAQIAASPVARVSFWEQEELSFSGRGQGGFGSTGER